jgi:hypothetical protein
LEALAGAAANTGAIAVTEAIATPATLRAKRILSTQAFLSSGVSEPAGKYHRQGYDSRDLL